MLQERWRGQLSPHPCTKATPGSRLPEGLAGRYVSDGMAAPWTFAGRDGAMEVEVAGPLLQAGPWQVEAVEADDIRVWVPGLLRGWCDLRLQRDGGGAVTGLVVNTSRLKSVEYRRAASP